MNSESLLNPNERIDQLATNDVKIIQSRDVFSYSVDATLNVSPNLPQTGANCRFVFGEWRSWPLQARVQMQASLKLKSKRLADMAMRSVQLNGLEQQVRVIQDDLAKTLDHLNPSSTDLIFCNPPYFKLDEHSRINESEHYLLALHELATNLDDICRISQQLLKTNGHLAMVHRPDRFFEIIQTMTQYNLVPKRIQFVYPKADRDANILLIDAIKDGKVVAKNSYHP